MRNTLTAAAAAAVIGRSSAQASAQQAQPLAAAPAVDAVPIQAAGLRQNTDVLDGARGHATATGDIVVFGRYPNTDFAYGGSIDGMIRGVDEVIAFAKDDTRIVPGHGPLGTKAMIRDYRQMLVDVRERISKLKAGGRSEDEVVAAKPNADYDAKFRLDERSIGK